MITFWNGNKSQARKAYELALLELCLSLSPAENINEHEQITEDLTDLPLAEQEGAVFEMGADVLVTVAGNSKFADKEKIVIEQDISKGLLGYRLLIVRAEQRSEFTHLNEKAELQSKSIGIPATWVDANLFRHNNFNVCEQGLFEELFEQLASKAFDYSALGANEIEQVCIDMNAKAFNIVIEPKLMLYYPYPLTFYVNKRKPTLAQRIEKGLLLAKANGAFDALFEEFHGDIIKHLALAKRAVFQLENPALPEFFKHFKPELSFI